MTGYQSKKTAALDEEGMYLVHQTDHSEDILQMVAQPAQEPVATIAVRWHEPVGKVAYVLEVNLPVGIHELYPTPPQRQWVGLTPQDLNEIFAVAMTGEGAVHLALEKIKDKNNG